MVKPQLPLLVLLGLWVGLGNAIAPSLSVAQTPKYYCKQLNGIYRTFVHTSSQEIDIIKWVKNTFNTNPRDRCIEVSKRFNAFADNGMLKNRYLRTGVFNNYPVICVAHTVGGTCPKGNVLVTLERGADADATLNELLDLRRRARVGGIPLSDDLMFYDEGNFYVDLQVWEQQLEQLPNETLDSVLNEN